VKEPERIIVGGRRHKSLVASEGQGLGGGGSRSGR